MTEQKPVAWIYEYDNGARWVRACEEHPPFGTAVLIRNVVPLYKHPAPPTEQKPVAWIYDVEYPSLGRQPVLNFGKPEQDHPFVTGTARPLYEHPAPAVGLAGSATSQAAQPATDAAVEAARRKALRVVFRALSAVNGHSDFYSVRLSAGVLRDLVGDRPDDTRVSICGYDEEPLCEDEGCPHHGTPHVCRNVR